MTTVELRAGALLSSPNLPMKYAYFLNSGVVSLLITTKAGESISAAMIGPEGFVGTPLALGHGSLPGVARVQIGGTACRCDGNAFRHALHLCPILRSLTSAYALSQLNDAMQSIACSRYHTIEERLATKLLKIADRVGPEFRITQEIIAHMLGCRRATITLEAEKFQKRHLIAYKYGRLRLLDRTATEALACECYEAHLVSFSSFLKP